MKRLLKKCTTFDYPEEANMLTFTYYNITRVRIVDGEIEEKVIKRTMNREEAEVSLETYAKMLPHDSFFMYTTLED